MTFLHTLSTKSSEAGGSQGLLLFFCPLSSVLYDLCPLPFPTMPFPSPLTFPSISAPCWQAERGLLAGINQPMGFTGVKQTETSGGLFPPSPASLLTPLPALTMPRSLRRCLRGAGRLTLGGGRDTASQRHCTWSSKGTTTFLNIGFLWTNSILFTYLGERGKKKMNTAAAPTL